MCRDELETEASTNTFPVAKSRPFALSLRFRDNAERIT